MNGYEQRNIPLDTLVTDMDWHITFYREEGKKDQVKNLLVEVFRFRVGLVMPLFCILFCAIQAGEQIGWTGFTWDNHLFPNPKGFLDWYIQVLYCCLPGG